MKKRKHSAEGLLEELWAIALAKATDLLQVKDGALVVRDTDELTPSQQAAIASVEKSTTGVKVKFYDKLKALELLGKYLGLFDGREGTDDARQDNLLAAILEATKEEVSHAVSDIQPQAAAGNDLVEQTRS